VSNLVAMGSKDLSKRDIWQDLSGSKAGVAEKNIKNHQSSLRYRTGGMTYSLLNHRKEKAGTVLLDLLLSHISAF